MDDEGGRTGFDPVEEATDGSQLRLAADQLRPGRRPFRDALRRLGQPGLRLGQPGIRLDVSHAFLPRLAHAPTPLDPAPEGLAVRSIAPSAGYIIRRTVDGC